MRPRACSHGVGPATQMVQLLLSTTVDRILVQYLIDIVDMVAPWLIQPTTLAEIVVALLDKVPTSSVAHARTVEPVSPLSAAFLTARRRAT